MSQFTNIIFTLLAMIFVLGPLIALHEWGHYIVARLCGVKVITYSIGFGKQLWSWRSPKTGINYQISALPLGGYVKMLDGREGDIPTGEEHLAFDRQHPLKKIAIVIAGPVMNFIIAIVLFSILFMTPMEQFNTRIGTVIADSSADRASIQSGDKVTAIEGKAVATWEDISYILADKMGETDTISVTMTPYQADTPLTDSKTYAVKLSDFMQGENKGKDPLEALGILPWNIAQEIQPIIHELTPDGAGIRQGLQIGDEIIQINDIKVDNWLTAVLLIKNNPEQSLNITVLRDGDPLTLDVMPRGVKQSGTSNSIVGKIGAGIDGELASTIKVPNGYTTMVEYPPIPAVFKAVDKTYDLSLMTLKSMGKMVTGMIGLDNLSGPITIAKVAKQSFDISWQMVLSTAGLISLSLAVLNLLPIPVLDGGHMLFYLIELIRGKPLSDKTQIFALNIGFVIMGGLMLLAIGMDISRFF